MRNRLEPVLNYHALTVAILTECNVEMAFEKLQCEHPESVKGQFTKEDIEDMAKLKSEGVSWKELGEIFGVPWTTVYGRIRPRNNGRKVVSA